MKNLHNLSNNWRTPQDLFDVLDKGGEYMGMPFKGFHFEIDLCATKENSKCKIWYKNYLKDIVRSNRSEEQMSIRDINLNGYEIQTAFMNPPYSNPKPFIEKAWEDSKHCKIVCLVKCDPSTQWWSTFWEYLGTCPFCMDGTEEFEAYSFNSGLIEDVKGFCMSCAGSQIYSGPKQGCQVLFFPKRIKFDPPQELIDSGEVWKVGNKWVQKCRQCWFVAGGVWCRDGSCTGNPISCKDCNGKGYKKLSGPSFGCALLIFDRRGL